MRRQCVRRARQPFDIPAELLDQPGPKVSRRVACRRPERRQQVAVDEDCNIVRLKSEQDRGLRGGKPGREATADEQQRCCRCRSALASLSTAGRAKLVGISARSRG